MAAFMLKVENCPGGNAAAFKNRIYLSKGDFERLKGAGPDQGTDKDTLLVELFNGAKGFVFTAGVYASMTAGAVGVTGMQRRTAMLELDKEVRVEPFRPAADIALSTVTIVINLLKKTPGQKPTEVDCKALSEFFKNEYGAQVFTANQKLAVLFKGLPIDATIESLQYADLNVGSSSGGNARTGGAPGAVARGQLLASTEIEWTVPSTGSAIRLKGASSKRPDLFTSDFDFTKLGIGGLARQFEGIFRRAFASRLFPPHIVSELGIPHVRGMLLYGPPGCGKTLIARQIGKVLNAREPKIVNGPEVLDKYVGGSEEKIRALFADAEAEQAAAGDDSMLHIIIFDEIDAICKSRGSVSNSTGVNDSIVNQLLSKIDGVDSLNNILVIGMTNRKDMIDDAVLRPGRLEVHIEIGLPDEPGRLQILQIKTASMREHNRLAKDADARMPELAARTKNFSGAEIEGLCKAAGSYALRRGVDAKGADGGMSLDDSKLVVAYEDFERALDSGEVSAAFGAKEDELARYYVNGIIDYGEPLRDLRQTLRRLVDQVRTSDRTPLLTVMLEGDAYTGKTALAAATAVESDFPFVRSITADSMIGYSESAKCQAIHKVFMDSYKSQLSLLLIDDLERILEYTPIGPRFSNPVLQTLLVLLKKPPPEAGRRLLVVGTTAVPHLLDDLQLVSAFNVSLHVPKLDGPEETSAVLCDDLVGMSKSTATEIASAISKPIGIKRLLTAAEMARADAHADGAKAGDVAIDQFLACLHTVGY